MSTNINKLKIKNSFLPLLILPILLVFNSACKDENLPIVPNCCANPPLVETVGLGKIYIPNIFTPSNQDGFGVFVNKNIEVIESLEIFTANGNLVFSEMDIQPLDASFLWDGLASGSTPRAMYDVQLTVISKDGVSANFDHRICSFYCLDNESKEPTFNALPECRFATQHNGFGEVDDNQPSFDEFDCLE